MGALAAFSSCDKDSEFISFLKNKEATVNAEGGTVTAKTTLPFNVAYIEFITAKDTSYYSYPIDNPEAESQIQWIKLKLAPKEMTVTTDPNTTGEERKALIILRNGNTFNLFSVTQSK